MIIKARDVGVIAKKVDYFLSPRLCDIVGNAMQVDVLEQLIETGSVYVEARLLDGEMETLGRWSIYISDDERHWSLRVCRSSL